MSKAKKVLIIEDDRPILKALETKFSQEGFEVLIATNGKEGLQVLAKESPDIILLDVVMPQMDGIEFLEEMHADKKTSSTPVLVLTNLSDSDTIARAAVEKVAGYLIKADWRLEDVVIKVKEILNIK